MSPKIFILITLYPFSFAVSSIACKQLLLFAMTWFSIFACFGVSDFWLCNPFPKICKTSIGILLFNLYFSTMFIASWYVVSSMYVVPDAIDARSSFSTSDITKLTPLHFMFSTNFPPLIFDRCFLIQLNSWIVAPDFSSKSVTCTLSLSVISSGIANNDEPPPETRKIINSSLFLLWTNFITSFAAFTLVLSGFGWLELKIWNFLLFIFAFEPFGMTIIPLFIVIIELIALVIESAAFPKATV